MSNLARIRRFCLAFPDSIEAIQFGHPFFKWKDKPFCVYGDHEGEHISIKVEKQSQQVFLEDPRFTITPYIGRHGWITLALKGKLNWEEIEELIRGSYQFVSAGKPKAKKKQK